MSARGWLYLVLLVLVLALGGLGYLFWVQNSSQLVTVSLEFWGGWRRGRTMPVPELIAWSAGGGFLLAFLPMFVFWLGRGRRIRQLEQQVAMNSTGSGDGASSWR